MSNTSTFLNSVLSRWLAAPTVQRPQVNCQTCTQGLAFKCCTFQPFLPNFLAGAVLEAQGSLRFAGEHCWQPIGLVPAQSFRHRHARTPEAERGEELLCRFYDSKVGSCSIWEFRPGECSSFFCVPVVELESLSESAHAVEVAVAQMALVQLGFSRREISEQVDVLNEGLPLREWDSSEVESHYRRSWEWARNVRMDEVKAWLEDA